MAPRYRIVTFSNGHVEIVKIPLLYKVLHDIEMGKVRDEVIERGVALPEVNPFIDNHFTALTEKWQWLWKNLNQSMTKLQWRALLDYQRAFTNQNGFDKPNDQRADYVNNRDLTKPLPKMEALVCGGATVAVDRIEGQYAWIKTLNGLNPPPPVEYILARPWLYFHATTVRPNGTVGSFPQSTGAELVPLLTNRVVKYPLARLKKLDGRIPSPYVIGA